MERHGAKDRLAAAKAATLHLADTLGLRLVDGRRLRIAAEPPPQIEETKERKDLRIAMARAWANALLATDGVFGSALTGTPAWAILIDLYISEADNRRVAISDACHAARIPATTALRWVNVLEERGYIYRRNDPKDGRRVFLRLTSLGTDKLETVLDRTAQSDEKSGLGRLSVVE